MMKPKFVISTVGVELKEAIFVDKEGQYILRIEDWEEDGITQAGDVKFNVHFKGVIAGTKEPVYTHTERFSLGRAAFRIKQLEQALRSPENFDINDWVGRYVVSNIVSEQYEKNGEIKTAYKTKTWNYSKFNERLPPIPEAKADEQTEADVEVDIEDIEDDDIPF